MSQDITASIDQSAIVDGATIDAADVTTALNNFITVLNAMLNGTQDFDRLIFEDAETLTVSGGVVSAPTKALVILAAESGTSDDIDTITASNNRFAVFWADSGDTNTLKNGTGNIYTGGADVVLSGNVCAIGICRGGNWTVISAGGAPSNATYITQTANSGLSAEQALSSLSTGLVKVTTGTGVLSTATPDTDYQVPLKVAVIRDEKASGTDGGSSSAATWNNRTLNTEASDVDNIVTLSSNKFTPIAGVYRIQASAPAKETSFHKLRLYNVTGGAAVDYGPSAQSSTADATQTTALLDTIFTANGTDEYRIDHYTAQAKATVGLGTAASVASVIEIYCTATLTRLHS